MAGVLRRHADAVGHAGERHRHIELGAQAGGGCDATGLGGEAGQLEEQVISADGQVRNLEATAHIGRGRSLQAARRLLELELTPSNPAPSGSRTIPRMAVVL